MAEYYKIGLYSTNDFVELDSEGFVDIDDLGIGAAFLEIEVSGAGAKIQMNEPQEMVGGYLKQETSQRLLLELPVKPLNHPADADLRFSIYEIFNKENIFIIPIDYDDSDRIAPAGKARQVAGVIDTEDIYEDGTKELLIKLYKVNV